MKTLSHVSTRWIQPIAFAALFALVVPAPRLAAEPAEVLFEDQFEGGIPGWTAVQPAGGAWIEGPMLWVYDKVSDSFGEQSNIYTGASVAGSATRFAVMLIHDTTAPATFSYTARLTAGDDDGFGLIWGYENESTFYRIAFSRQGDRLVGWPALGVTVDRMDNNVPTDIVGPDSSFINAVGRPFDVSIGVTNSLLTVVVTDDPLGTIGGPFVYNLATGVALPTAVAGRVGMFSWGMSGNNPRAFQVQNPTLNGTDLSAAAASQVLSNWSFVVPPRQDGLNTFNSGGTVPNWGQALGINGDRKVMIQNSDSFNSTDNNATGNTNFIAASAVAGDPDWTNYVVSARFISADNDGFGLLLRYQNETNFYRMAFRNQNAQTGIRRGLTVQKNVDQVFDQVYSNGVAGFIPPVNVPFEVHAAIQGSTLQIIAINNPDGDPVGTGTLGGTATPTATSTGPIALDASTIAVGSLDSGKIGIISWAQYGDNNLPNTTAPDDGTAVDWVKVREVNGVGLLVNSPYGSPTPPNGLNDLPANQSVTASVEGAVSTSPGVRQIAIGWSGVGSVPAGGEGNEVTFQLNTLSLITWNWQLQYELNVSATAGGSVNATAGPWINANESVTVNAVSNPGYVFVGWSGDSISASASLTFPMTRPITLTANFAVDSDNDGLPDSWEMLYFNNLAQGPHDNPDMDDADNITEFRRGSNPAYAEGLVLNDGLLSRWINEADDRALPGWFVVTNFGSGFRGLWENSNQNRNANSPGPNDGEFLSPTSYATNASFQGPYLVVRSNAWNPVWAGTFSLSAEYSVGDNDGLSLYFRYLNKSNWYRVTVCGELTSNPLRPLQGITLQKRTNGWFSAITPSSEAGFFYTDPLDITGYKRFRVTVNGTNDNFEVQVIGWNVFLSPPDWDPSSEVTLTFTDGDLPSGRIGIGPWGMGALTAGTWNSTTNNPNAPGVQMNPVGQGLYMDNIILQVSGTNAFVEDWETAPIHTDLPAGWENPYVAEPVGGLLGDWNVSGHGTIASFTRAFGTPQSGTLESPKADGEGPMLLAPALTNANYVLELGIHPLDDGGMGFVYDYEDTDNFARVMFNSQVPLAGQMAQGVNVSRKSGGVWTTIAAGDNTFIYTPGRRFATRFANNNGTYTLSAWNVDAPVIVYRWQWTDQSVANNRVGVAIWDMPDAHYDYFRVLDLPELAPVVPFEISNISIVGGNVVLDVTKPDGVNYHVLRATSVTGPYTTNAANQSATQYSEPAPVGNTYFYRLQLLP